MNTDVRASGVDARRVAGVSKIAVLRANALGDYIVCLPALEALKAVYPQAEIVLLAKSWHADFLQNRPGSVDRVIPIPAYRGVGEPPDAEENSTEIEAFMRRMVEEKFDLAIQLHGGGGYSNPFIQKLGARVTVGLQADDAPPLDRNVPYVHYQSEILRFLEVVGLVGAPVVTFQPRLSVTQADLQASYEVVPDTGRPLVVLHPGATDPRRRWSASKFAAVGDALNEAGASVLVTGSDWERDAVVAVVQGMQTPALNLCGRLSLSGLTGLLSRCKLIVSNDTGPRHLAEAVGRATVGIYWCGNLVNYGPPTRTRHRPATSWQVACPVCGTDCTRRQCEHLVSFVDAVEASEVIQSALQLLKS